jgi:hypothetical protein
MYIQGGSIIIEGYRNKTKKKKKTLFRELYEVFFPVKIVSKLVEIVIYI